MSRSSPDPALLTEERTRPSRGLVRAALAATIGGWGTGAVVLLGFSMGDPCAGIECTDAEYLQMAASAAFAGVIGGAAGIGIAFWRGSRRENGWVVGLFVLLQGALTGVALVRYEVLLALPIALPVTGAAARVVPTGARSSGSP